MTIVAAIPAYNEEIGIGSVIARTRQYVDEVLVIDDGSADCTYKVAELMGATVLRHEKNAGKGAALRTAFKWAMDNNVDILVTLDGDGQHNPDEIPRLLEPILQKDADMVNGARFLKGHDLQVPKYRRLGQEVLTFATNLGGSFESKINDSQSGFRAFAGNTFDTFTFNNNGMGIESEMLADASSASLRIKEVPITCRYDVEGSTFNPLRHGAAVLSSILNQFERKHPLLYFGVPGFICMFLGLVFGFWTIYGYRSGDGFWIGKALLAMTFILVGVFGIFSGLILNSMVQFAQNIKKSD
ncbi:glycosyl transferase [Methanomethylovorans hollandica DSM 15978]|uniref:Glycosyl transferase n=1 Tax=Methanomethylovorans hollandica (strain DSM 15978 / NBRC 107637 / DMS1) TaxID=867904 RepID=L0KYC4_METHD|nr:glycosyltransferase family 2 protein [Methanomethylovorans hollandica]AGB49690.1 glycosyl transferase [Methanomethylovorans hollandica DSM 15978]